MEINWKPVEPPVYQRGDLYETQSVECGYSPDYLFQATYSDGSTRTVECNGFGILSMSDVKPEGYQASAMTDAVIGSCVTEIGRYAFSYCDGLTSINIPDNVRYIDLNAFAGLKNLKTVHIGKGVCYIESGAFNGCDGLDSITIEAITPPVLDDEFGNNWFNDTNNCPIFVPCQSLNAYKTASGWSQYADRIFGIPPCIPEQKLQATYSGGQTYEKECDGNTALKTGDTRPSGYELSAMTTAIIGDCVTSIDYQDAEHNGVFKNCISLTSVTIADSVISIGSLAFEGCSNLSGITLPSNLDYIGGYAFNLCSNLSSITFPDTLRFIGVASFQYCSSLTNIVIPSGITTWEGASFGHCYSLTSVTIPDTVTKIPYGVFNQCYNLTSVGLKGSGASVELPDNITSIEHGAFSNCSGLTSITIPDSITSIEYATFYGCKSIISMVIPSGVTSIGSQAFEWCSSLTSITVNAATPPTLGNNAFNLTNNCPIYVPVSSLQNYKTASGWSDYADRIFPIT